MLHTATSKARVIALAGFAALAVVGAALWQTDLLVARGFGKALEVVKTHPVVPVAPPRATRSRSLPATKATG